MNDPVNNQHIESNRCIHGFYVDACLLCPSSVVTMTKAREAFEQFIKNSPNYNKLLLIHGERLFIFEDGQYKNLHVQLAWEVWQEQIKSASDAIKVAMGLTDDDIVSRRYLQPALDALHGG